MQASAKVLEYFNILQKEKAKENSYPRSNLQHEKRLSSFHTQEFNLTQKEKIMGSRFL